MPIDKTAQTTIKYTHKEFVHNCQTFTVESYGKGPAHCFIVGFGSIFPDMFPTELIQGKLSTEKNAHLTFHSADFYWTHIKDKPKPDKAIIDSLTIDSLIEQIDAARQALELDKIGLFGHSSLGTLALAYAAKYPQHTSFVLTIGTPLYALGAELTDNEQKFLRSTTPKRIHAYKEATLAHEKTVGTESNPPSRAATPNTTFVSWAATLWPRSLRQPDQLGEELSDKWRFSSTRKVVGELMRNHFFNSILPTLDPKELLKKTKCHILWTQGKEDYITRPDAIIKLADDGQLPPNVTLSLFENSAHYLPMEEPIAFAQALRAFLEQLPESDVPRAEAPRLSSRSGSSL
jgi:proline iminopeptidase